MSDRLTIYFTTKICDWLERCIQKAERWATHIDDIRIQKIAASAGKVQNGA